MAAPETSRPEASGHTVLPATRARQGRWGRHVFWVLLVSTTLAAIALLAAWAWRSDDLAAVQPKNDGKVAPAHSFDSPEPAPATRQ
jgi:hypothetical protein